MLLSLLSINDQLTWLEKEKERYYLLNGDAYSDQLEREKEISVDELNSIGSGLYQPTSVFGLAFNYKSLIGKTDKYEEPLLFLKSVNSLSFNSKIFRYPSYYNNIWVECELVIIIKRDCKNIRPEEAEDYILGYTIGSDITAANKYSRDHHLALSKAGDGFAPIYNWINTDLSTENLIISTKINGKVLQQDSTKNRIWNDCESVANLSKYFTLKKGDLIFTGTPAGAMDSIIRDGDFVEHSIQNIGTLDFLVSESLE